MTDAKTTGAAATLDGTDAVELLLSLVRIPSPSGEEEAVARELEAWGLRHGLEVERGDWGVRLSIGDPSTGPLLLLASHLDTVPAGEGWTVDPTAAVPDGDRLVARGAVDAKPSVAGMATAAARLAASGGPARGALVVLATFCEETAGTTMATALETLPRRPDAAVIGEPTLLRPCIAQRGLLILRGVWSGEQKHAGWAADAGAPVVNAIERAAEDVVRVAALEFPEEHAVLGKISMTPTTSQAGVARNMTPPECEVVWDVRTTPALDHATIAQRVRETIRNGELEVLSDRFHPAATPEGSKLLATLLSIQPDREPFASPTASDWVWMRDVDAVKLGPGDSRQSHTPDETLELDQVRQAASLYETLAREFLA